MNQHQLPSSTSNGSATKMQELLRKVMPAFLVMAVFMVVYLTLQSFDYSLTTSISQQSIIIGGLVLSTCVAIDSGRFGYFFMRLLAVLLFALALVVFVMPSRFFQMLLLEGANKGKRNPGFWWLFHLLWDDVVALLNIFSKKLL